MHGISPLANVSSVPFGSWQGSVKQVSFSHSVHLPAVPQLPLESSQSEAEFAKGKFARCENYSNYLEKRKKKNMKKVTKALK